MAMWPSVHRKRGREKHARFAQVQQPWKGR